MLYPLSYRRIFILSSVCKGFRGSAPIQRERMPSAKLRKRTGLFFRLEGVY